MASDCPIAPCKVQNDGRVALADGFHQHRRPGGFRASCTTHRQRRGKASATRDDRTWWSKEEDDTYGSLVLDRRERIVGSLSRRRLELVMSPITDF